MNPENASIIRALLKIGSGYALAKGIGDSDLWETVISGIIGVIAIIWGYKARKSAKATGPSLPNTPLIMLLGVSVALAFSSGCARFITRQTDISYDSKGNKIRAVTTTAKATTLLEAKSQLSNFKASQTDKTQSATVGSLNQESVATNAVAQAGQFLGELIKAAAK